MQATLNLNTLKAVVLAASNEATRFYLRGVCVEVDANGVTYVATDGYILLSIRDDLAEGAERNTLSGTWIIGADTIAQFKVKKSDSLPLAVLEAAGVKLTLTPLGGNGLTFALVDGTFPDWRRVVPDNVQAFEPITAPLAFKDAGNFAVSQFSPDQLARLQKAAQLLGGHRLPPVPRVHHAKDHTAPAPVTFGPDINGFGVIMPYRVGARDWQVPTWARIAQHQETKAAAE